MINPRHISSRQNPQFKRWVSLLDSQGVKAHQQCLVSGAKLRKNLLQHSSASVREILLPPSVEIPESLPSHATGFVLTQELFHELDVFGTKDTLVICTTPSMPPCDLTQPPIGLELLCPIGDPGNLGALLRSCRVFGAGRVILLREAVHPFHPKVIRASSGAVFVQSLSLGCSVAELQRPEFLQWICALDMHGDDVATTLWSPNVRLLIGEEGIGIPSFSFPQRLCIPQIHTSIPLNATVASSIALYAYRQQHPH